MSSDNPILNSPYYEPKLHYATDSDGSLNYNDVSEYNWLDYLPPSLKEWMGRK